MTPVRSEHIAPIIPLFRARDLRAQLRCPHQGSNQLWAGRLCEQCIAEIRRRESAS